jgi:F0F1-type ATP synthase assembly protein I
MESTKTLLNKKGQIGDMFFVIFMITSIAITFIVAGYVYKQIDTGFSESGLETNESSIAYDQFESSFKIFDSAFIFIILGLTIGIVISSFQIQTHPIFLVLNIIGILVLIFLGAVSSNLYTDVISQEGMNVSALAYYPITTNVMAILPWIAVAIAILVTIIMYAKGEQL